MNAISFSLWGTDPKYCVGAAKNLLLAREFYPGWQCVFWTNGSVPSQVISWLTANGAMMKDASGLDCCGYFWRFLINDDPSIDRYMIRDSDSRINERESVAVKEWLASGKKFHVMRDHPHHATEMMGGMWGGHPSGAIGSSIKAWTGAKFGYCSDQTFLKEKLWPLIQEDVLQHDSCTRHLFPGSKPFPSRLSYTNPRFVGEVFDEFDTPREYDWEYILNHIEKEAA